jgi:hypothetical protein
MVITRVKPMSCAKIFGTVYAVLGLLVGAIATLVMTTIGRVMPEEASEMGAMFGAFLGAGAIIILPICYGLVGFIGGAIGAVAYNVVAGWVGGIEFETGAAG